MSFLIRAVMILLAFAFVVYVLKAIARLSFNLRGALKDLRGIRQQVSERPAANAEMVRCVSCGAFVSSRDALTVSSRNRSQVFCSQSCMLAKVAS